MLSRALFLLTVMTAVLAYVWQSPTAVITALVLTVLTYTSSSTE